MIVRPRGTTRKFINQPIAATHTSREALRGGSMFRATEVTAALHDDRPQNYSIGISLAATAGSRSIRAPRPADNYQFGATIQIVMQLMTYGD